MTTGPWDENKSDQVLREITSEPARGDYRTTPGIEGVAIDFSCTHCTAYNKLIVLWHELVAARGGQAVIDGGTGKPCVALNPANGAIEVQLACGHCGNRADMAVLAPWEVDQQLNIARSRGFVR